MEYNEGNRESIMKGVEEKCNEGGVEGKYNEGELEGKYNEEGLEWKYNERGWRRTVKMGREEIQ